MGDSGDSGNPIEAFLRRVHELRQLQQGEGAPLNTAPPVQAEILPAQLVDHHVTTSIDTSRVTQRAEHFADKFKQRDSASAAHTHQALDRDLTRLDNRAPSQTPGSLERSAPAINIAAHIKALLTDPLNVKSAVILAEIFRRRS